MAEQKIRLPVKGMSCTSCAQNIERSLKKLNGIKEANVNFAVEQATVTFDPQLAHIDDLVKQVQSSGYDVMTNKVELPITGMTCTNCAMNIEKA